MHWVACRGNLLYFQQAWKIMECERYMKICVNIYDNACVETVLCNRSWLLNGWLPLIPCPLNLPFMLEWTQGNFFIVVSTLYDLSEYNMIFTMFKKYYYYYHHHYHHCQVFWWYYFLLSTLTAVAPNYCDQELAN